MTLSVFIVSDSVWEHSSVTMCCPFSIFDKTNEIFIRPSQYPGLNSLQLDVCTFCCSQR